MKQNNSNIILLNNEKKEITIHYNEKEWIITIEQSFDYCMFELYEVESFIIYNNYFNINYFNSNKIFNKTNSMNNIIEILINLIQKNKYSIEFKDNNILHFKIEFEKSYFILDLLKQKYKKTINLINKIYKIQEIYSNTRNELNELKNINKKIEKENKELNIVVKELKKQIETLNKEKVEPKMKSKQINNQNKSDLNFIKSIYNITKKNISKETQIINYNKNTNNDSEIKQSCEIIINKEIFKFKTKHKFCYGDFFLLKFNFKNPLIDSSRLFFYCTTLQSIDLSNFNTKKIKNMESMFSMCSSLISINLVNFNTENVTNMSYMFNECTSLQFLDLSYFSTQNVNNMEYMFQTCSNLKFLDLSNFQIQKNTNIKSMFYKLNSECEILSDDKILLRKNDEKYNDYIYD